MALVTPDSGPYLSKLQMRNGDPYVIKDAWARLEIAEIEKAIGGGVHFRGVSNTAIADGDNKKEITLSDGTTKIAAADQVDGDIFIYPKPQTGGGTKNLEFIVSNGKYSELGSTGNLGTFAYASQGVGSATVPISSAITFNAITPNVTNGTLGVDVSYNTIHITTTESSATGKFSPAAITIAASAVTITPSTNTFTALGDVTYDSDTATLTITDVTSPSFWTGYTSAQAAGQKVTPTANQNISVSYDRVVNGDYSVAEDVSLIGSIGVGAVTPTATITNPSITVTVSPVSS